MSHDSVDRCVPVRYFASFVYALALFAFAADAAAGAPAHSVAGRPFQRIDRLVLRGVTAPLRPANAANRHRAPAREELRGYRLGDARAVRPRSGVSFAPRIAVPIVPSRHVVPADATFFGFPGLADADQFSAGSGSYANTQFESEPPDPALCAGNGYVLEAVNDSLAMYAASGVPRTAPTPLNEFFMLAPEISSANVYGPFVSAPKCTFDRDTQRWFITAFEIDANPFSGYLYGASHSSLLVAVSHTPSPDSAFSVYTLDTTDSANPGCPCFGDEPLLGADANALYVSTNEFPIGGSIFNGVQIYALPKLQLALGALQAVVHIDVGALTQAQGAAWSSIQPATAPDTAPTNRTGNGTEYLLSSLDTAGQGASAIAVWALTNTQSLLGAAPNVALQHITVPSLAYLAPPPALQRPGSAPLGAALRLPLARIDTGDDRMTQVIFAGGRLWSAVTTAVHSGGMTTAGAAFFSVAPTLDAAGTLRATMRQQAYVAVAGQNVIEPAVGVNAGGRAILAATLTGPAYYPSAVYVASDGNVHYAGAGATPEDGFSGYNLFVGYGDYGYYPCCRSNLARWGAYSAAVADADGSIWIATEYTSAKRTIWANWGTFIGHVRP